VNAFHRQGSNANCGVKTIISGLCWYASDRYGLLVMVGSVGCVGGDFSQTSTCVCVVQYFPYMQPLP